MIEFHQKENRFISKFEKQERVGLATYPLFECIFLPSIKCAKGGE